MIIKRLKIKNFQSWKETVIELSPGINVIVGDTDQGKSAIVRAIRWAMRNRAGGDFWNKSAEEAGEDCLVGLALDDVNGHDGEIRVVRRRVKPGSNFYAVIEGEDRTEFTGFGREVPAPVRELVGQPVLFGKDLSYDFNISPQLESAFLISENPRNFTRVLGKLTNIDVLDVAEQLMASVNRELVSKAKTLREEHTKVAQELEGLPDPTDAIQIIGAAETVQDRVTSRQKELDDLTELSRDLGDSYFAHGVATGQLQPLTRIHEKASSICTLVSEKAESLIKLTGLRGGLESVKTRIIEAQVQLEAVPVIEADLDKRQKKAQSLIALESAFNSLHETETKLLKEVSDLEEVNQSLTTKRSELESLLQGTEICPLSGGELFASCKKLIGGN